MRYVFIHGAGCLADVFAAQAEAFPDALVPRLPGHGVAGTATTLDECADAVAELIESAHEGEMILAGHSMGGAIALVLALRADPRIRGVVLLGGGARMRVAAPVLQRLRDDFEAASTELARSFYAAPTEKLCAESLRQMHAVGREQTVRDFEACNGFDVRERLAGLSVPLLALTGTQDVLMPAKLGEEAASRVPRGEARTIDGAGHMLMIERPDDTNELLRTFVTRITS